MPPEHQFYSQWSPERFLRWAQEIGEQTAELISRVLNTRKHPEQAYRSCLGILGLAKRYSPERLEAACQRANAADPGLGLGLCIGVNAGEPIHEHGDIFGTPVQMAARVLSKAEGDEIAVSNIIREMCVGKEFVFSKKGDYDLKGFPEPVPIYLAKWQSPVELPVGEALPEPRISSA